MRISGIGFLPVRNYRNNRQTAVNNINNIASLSFRNKALDEGDSLEITKTQKPEAKGVIRSKQSIYPYYIISTPMPKRQKTLIADKTRLQEDVILILDKNLALNLSEQDFIKNLKDNESIRLSSNPKIKNGVFIEAGDPDEEENNYRVALEITRQGDSIYATDFSTSTNVGVAYQKDIENENASNYLRNKKLDNLQPLSDPHAAKFYREEGYKIRKGEMVEICPIEELDNSRKVFILPNFVFKIADQEKIKQLKDGEELIIGRQPATQPDDTDKDKTKGRINVKNSPETNVISRNHLVVKNDDGIIYVTDTSLNGTLLAEESWLRPKREILEIAKATLKDWF